MDAISFIRLSPGATFGEELDKRRQRRFDVASVDVVDAKQKVLSENFLKIFCVKILFI